MTAIHFLQMETGVRPLKFKVIQRESNESIIQFSQVLKF